jgi:hypothetical protein
VKLKQLILLPALLALVSCDGLFGGLYDEPAKNPFGFVQRDDDNCGGTLCIDATSHTRWTYIDLHHHHIDTANITLGQEAPLEWDFAIHHYDVKTNNGSAAESPFDNVGMAIELNGLDFVADADSQVVIDMSTMMDGYLGYTPSMVNPVLSHWLDVDLSTMPPIYTLSNKVYLLRLNDGTLVALQFTSYMDESFVKGIVTLRYRIIND